ncbi:unnamed protein product [Pieris macdunnoughi]|uniref:Uncharacterized protein n=1 Tax=Pieris macdunnoughi TaxID=345717 RepID=A0A821Y120_9NEOP|nr:unnamed protein product [Pieris macdunnoughi]
MPDHLVPLGPVILFHLNIDVLLTTYTKLTWRKEDAALPPVYKKGSTTSLTIALPALRLLWLCSYSYPLPFWGGNGPTRAKPVGLFASSRMALRRAQRPWCRGDEDA